MKKQWRNLFCITLLILLVPVTSFSQFWSRSGVTVTSGVTIDSAYIVGQRLILRINDSLYVNMLGTDTVPDVTIDHVIGDTVWTDMKVPLTRGQRGRNDLPDFSYDSLGLLFPNNDTTEQVFLIIQWDHGKQLGGPLSPHIHYVQTTDTFPTFGMKYRWYDNGDTIPDWTIIYTNQIVLPYTGGNMLQMLEFPMIEGIDEGVSSMMDIILYRKDNAIAGDVLTKEFDIHYTSDQVGSRQEYVK
jgi:hypothetical protein